jgi:hypothetical protein
MMANVGNPHNSKITTNNTNNLTNITNITNFSNSNNKSDHKKNEDTSALKLNKYRGLYYKFKMK